MAAPEEHAPDEHGPLSPGASNGGLLLRLVALVLLAAAILIGTPSIASSGEVLDLEVDLISPSEPLGFRYRFPSGTCEQGAFDLTVEANGANVVPLSVQQSPVTSDVFTFTIPPDTPGGELSIDAECHDGGTLFTGHGEKEWGSLTVTKMVTGVQPLANTLFNVIADCRATDGPDELGTTNVPTDFTLDLTYTASGGLRFVYTDHPVECTLTEPFTGGATTIIIDPDIVHIDVPGQFSASVTNEFAIAPIVVEPDFTG